MANKSKGFLISPGVLHELFGSISADSTLGHVVDHPLRSRPVRASEAMRYLERSAGYLAIEAQDRARYVVHFSDEKPTVVHLVRQPTVVQLVIGPESPIFIKIRREHFRWSAKHPKWKR